jgi:hypothetical protein
MSEHTADSSDDPLDALLSRMPEIAKAVSAFPEGVQQSAFDALIAAASGAATPAPLPGQAGDGTSGGKKARSPRRKRQSGDESTSARPRRSGTSQPKLVKDLDLRPKGKKSLADFVQEKNPTSNHDKNTVTVYYLANIAGTSPVTRDQVFTAYREMGWKLPSNFANSLQLTATKKRYLDTSNADDLRLLNPGLNRVEQDLPLQQKKTK